MNSTVMMSVFNKHAVDGKLDRKGFKTMALNLGHHLTKAQVDIAFSLLDTDHSGFISLEEFVVFWRQDNRFQRLQLNDAQLAKVNQISDWFIINDSDESGVLERPEFERMVQQMEAAGYNIWTNANEKTKRMGFEFDMGEKLLDKDKDGTVEFNELMSFMIDQGSLDSEDGVRPVHG